jgi:hypothetical protein
LRLTKSGNRQLVGKRTRFGIYRDYARAFSDTTGMPIASLTYFNRIFREILGQSPTNSRRLSAGRNKRGLRADLPQKTHTFCQGRMSQARESAASLGDEIGKPAQSS